MTKFPKHEGVFWASFDNGEKVVEVALVHVGTYEYSSSLEDGAYVTFVSDRKRFFEMASLSQEIVQPVRRGANILGMESSHRGNEVRVTWLAEVKAPRRAPKPGDGARAV